MGYICDGSYRNEVNQSFKQAVISDSLVDSVSGHYNGDKRTVIEVALTC